MTRSISSKKDDANKTSVTGMADLRRAWLKQRDDREQYVAMAHELVEMLARSMNAHLGHRAGPPFVQFCDPAPEGGFVRDDGREPVRLVRSEKGRLDFQLCIHVVLDEDAVLDDPYEPPQLERVYAPLSIRRSGQTWEVGWTWYSDWRGGGSVSLGEGARPDVSEAAGKLLTEICREVENRTNAWTNGHNTLVTFDW